MKKGYKQSNRNKAILSAAMAVAMGLLPFPGTAWADDGVTLTGDGVACYTGIGGGSAFFKNYKDDTAECIVKSTTADATSVGLFGVDCSDFTKVLAANTRTTGVSQAMKISYFVAASFYNNVVTPTVSDGETPNAIVVSIYDAATGTRVNKIIMVIGGSLTTVTSPLLSSYITATTFNNAEVQKEIYAAIASGDEAALNAVMEKYLPKLYYVYLDAATLASLSRSSDISDTTINYTGNLSTDGAEINVKWPLASVGTLSDTDKTVENHSYNSVTLAANAVWRPTDRAIQIDAAAGGSFSIAKYWVTGSQGTEPASEYNGVLTDTTGSTITNQTGSDGEVTAVTSRTVISTKELTTGANSLIDLSYANTVGGLDSYAYNDTGYGFKTGLTYEAGSKTYDAYVPTGRILLADEATLGNGTTFRLGKYGSIYTGVNYGAGSADKVYIVQAKQAQAEIDSGNKTTLYYQLGWVPGIGTSPYGEGEAAGEIGIYEGSENFEVVGQATTVDGIFSNYVITPTVIRTDNAYQTENSKLKYAQDADGYYYTMAGGDNTKKIIMNADGTAPFQAVNQDNLTQAEWDYLESKSATTLSPIVFDNTQGTSWTANYTYEDTGEMAESGKTVSENSTALSKIAKANNMNMFRRTDELHLSNLNKPNPTAEEKNDDATGLAGELRENIWADVWHGKFTSSAGYGRSVSQTYNGMQAGYDKLLGKKFYGGKVYTGFYLSKLDGNSNTATGNGEQDSYGIGVYSTWVGDKGHYLDAAVNAAKLKNEYYFTGNTGDGTIGQVKGTSSTWGYGLGLQYGKRNDLNSSGWFWEPSVSFYLGHVDENSYTLGNGLKINEKGYDTAISKLGLKTGKVVGNSASFYAGVNYGHEFAAGQELHQSYGTQSRLIDTVGGGDSWWEWTLGGKAKISPTGIATIDFIKTTGSEIGNEWSINGGVNWSWGGFGSGGKVLSHKIADSAPAKGSGIYAKAQAPTVVLGQALPVENITVAQFNDKETAVSNIPAAENDVPSAGVNPETESTASYASTASAAGKKEDLNSFELSTLTVEAARPDWEKNLSPGQVSVIYPEAYAGEQKNLPELLDRIPGLFIQRVNGVGHYTVARMRGSTASQVAVYVDGVLMNLTGDAAVNLSAIPADNIERIEVYRGYVPARFAGAPMGGVINIVTKKPAEGHGHISQGVRSYGGYTSNYEYSTPLGRGSLLATYSRDIWQGDFDFTYPDYWRDYGGGDGTFTRRSNDYQNNNGMLKWQDDHWIVKGVWKKEEEGLAQAVISRKWISDNYLKGYQDGRLSIDYKEFMLGRHDTFGNLDVGWHLAYLDSDKHYTNIGGYKAITDGLQPYYLPGQLWGTYHSKKWNGNLNMSMKMGTNHLVEFNGDCTSETMRTNGNDWDMTQEALDRETGETYTVRKMLSKYNNREYHLTLQDTITLNDDGDFKLTPIVRADKVEMEGLGNMGGDDSRWMYSGGAALQKQINSHWSFKSSWGTYNRHPNFYEIFGDGGFIGQNYVFTIAGAGGEIDNGLWEIGNQFDFSLNWQGKIGNAETDTILTYYKRRSKNQLVLWTPNGGNGLSCYCPTGIMDIYGLELSHNMKWKRLNLALAATWQKSQELDNGLGWQYNWSQSGSSFVPEWVISTRVDYLFPGDKLNVFGEYRYTGQEVLRGESSSDTNYNVRDSYSIVDLGVKYKFNKTWRLSAGVNDVFNRGPEVFMIHGNGSQGSSYYPLTGRMYYTTLEYSF